MAITKFVVFHTNITSTLLFHLLWKENVNIIPSYHTSKLCTAKLWPTMPYICSVRMLNLTRYATGCRLHNWTTGWTLRNIYIHVDRPSLIHLTCLCTWPYNICVQFYEMLKLRSIHFICMERAKWYINASGQYRRWMKRLVTDNKMISLIMICAEYSDFVWSKMFGADLLVVQNVSEQLESFCPVYNHPMSSCAVIL